MSDHEPNALADALAVDTTKLISMSAIFAGQGPKKLILEVLTRLLSMVADRQNNDSVLVIMERQKIEGQEGWRSKVRFNYLDADPEHLLDFNEKEGET